MTKNRLMLVPRFDLVVVLYQAPEETRAFLRSLLDLDPEPQFRLHVLDNSPDDAADDVLADELRGLNQQGIVVVNDRDRSNPGFARAVNRAAHWGSSEFIGLLNPDTRFLESDTLGRVAEMFDEQPTVAIQGPRQCTSAGHLIHSGWAWFPDGSRQGWRHDIHGSGEYRDVIDTEMITGSALFCRRRVWHELATCPNYQAACPDAEGPLGTFQHLFDDNTLCAHAFEHGHRLVYRGDIDMIHECASSAAPDSDYVQRAVREGRLEFDRVMVEMGISTRRTERSLS